MKKLLVSFIAIFAIFMTFCSDIKASVKDYQTQEQKEQFKNKFSDKYSQDVYTAVVNFYTNRTPIPADLVEKYDENLCPDVPVRPGDNVVAVGISLNINPLPQYSEIIGETGKISGFEADYRIVDKINEQIKATCKNTENIKIYPIALWNKNEYKKLYVGSANLEPTLLNFNSIFQSMNLVEDSDYIMVHVKKYDAFAKEKNITKTDFIEIDVEGADYQVLQGAENTVKNQKPNLAISIHFLKDIFNIVDYLDSLNLGYKYYLGVHNPCTDKSINVILYATAR